MTGDKEQLKAMSDILTKLNQVEKSVSNSNNLQGNNMVTEVDESASSGSVDEQTNEMKKILLRLKNSFEKSTSRIVNESAKDQELDFALKTEKTNDGVMIAKYHIQSEKQEIHDGLTKTFFHIYEENNSEPLFTDICLFETAMGIVKQLIYTNNISKINSLLDLDREYLSYAIETHSHKRSLKQLNESSTKYDIIYAKYTNSKSKLAVAKMRILKMI